MTEKCSKCGKELRDGDSRYRYSNGPKCSDCNDAELCCRLQEGGRCREVSSAWFGMNVSGYRESAPCDSCLFFQARDVRW